MQKHAYIKAAEHTAYGRLPGRSAIELMGDVACKLFSDAGVMRQEIDGVLCGYATTFPHLMLASLMSEKLGLKPSYAHVVQTGGATGAAMVMLARDLIRAGRCRNVLVIAGENRLSGQTTDASIQTLAQVGDADVEVPNGMSVPGYYALLAAQYMHRSGTSEADLAEFAVLMRKHASVHPQAHLKDPISVDDVLGSKIVATPLHLLDCCPISDGAAALIISADPGEVAITGAGQAHQHQHVSAIADIYQTGAAIAKQRALADAGTSLDDVDYLGIYDSFTITLAMLLEELEFAGRGQSAALLRAGVFDAHGKWPLNTHGGLLSFGHCGVAGGMAHIVEAYKQLSGKAGSRQISGSRHKAFVHADGGVLSAHVSLILESEHS
ncbi:MAG: thiolase family protein [Burkholderiaceae bacterium]|nr:thiolase family protein [Burkholderiaceae bacterium]MCD8516416.1 thiolase family protein [Burkholderiaceae bacterium]MCD8536847.1 thiolase family protein [Burkholderiaceae bacterium]MCD8565481.1 thiolase family protein [Burkholderiaceae bacterium]